MTTPSIAEQAGSIAQPLDIALDDNLLDDYALADRYTRGEGRVFLTGTQALVRIALRQAELDCHNSRHTAGLISGYRGSPLGGVDQEIWRAKAAMEEHHIDFVPAINEDLPPP